MGEMAYVVWFHSFRAEQLNTILYKYQSIYLHVCQVGGFTLTERKWFCCSQKVCGFIWETWSLFLFLKSIFWNFFWRTTRLAMFIPLCWCEGKHFYSRYHQNWEAYTRWINSATGQKKIFISCIFWFWTRLNFMYSVLHLLFLLLLFFCV